MALPSIKNSVGMAVTAVADAGVGTLTVGAALSGGYQTAGSAHGADAVSDFRFEEGDLWETAIDCTFDYSEGTITRGTQTGGSSGPSTRVAFTTAAKVYEILDETRIKRAIGGYLEHASHDGSAAVTGVVGTLHVFTGLTADRDFTLPASAQAGDRIGIAFPAGSASYEILLKSASGDKINNVICSTTEWSRLFIAGETVIFRCVDASTVDWIVEYDGRIPCSALVNGDVTSTVIWTNTAPDFAVASISQIGSIVDVANDQFIARRAGVWITNTHARFSAAGTNTIIISGDTFSQVLLNSSGTPSASQGGFRKAMAVGTTYKPLYQQNESTSEVITYNSSVMEVL